MERCILMDEFRVKHEGDFIFWEVDPPDADYFSDQAEVLIYKFNKKQYQNTIEGLIKNKALI